MSAVSYAAPGRINLIGEHTDYNLGFALPIALPERTVVTYAADDTEHVAVRSDHEDGDVGIPLDTAPGDVAGWAAYVAGVIWALRGAGTASTAGRCRSPVRSRWARAWRLGGAGMRGARRARHRSGLRVDRIELARIAQRAENDYVGAPTGLMDQLASLCGEPQRALMIDFKCRRCDPSRSTPMPRKSPCC